ncbi:MAG: 2Fe-2S iron-sulfur cluster-binding protein [Nitrospirae bacterium]|nr:2Fe-2S iron-sulfur cluster-binding protein [Nitrospirota bacterium]
MGGSNPYIEKAETEAATQTFTVTFHSQDGTQEVQVDPEKIPYGPTGLPGSLLDIAMGAGIDVEHACGGVCACSTCHVMVKEGLETCNESTEDEDDQLDEAPGISLQSRLACQCVPNGTKNIVVEIPEWNKNLVKE